MKKRTIIIVIMGAAILLTSGLFLKPKTSVLGLTEDVKQTTFTVKLSGAVRFPGEYEVSSGMTLAEVISLSGGFLSGAGYDAVNLAKKVKENMLVNVSYKITDDFRKPVFPIFEETSAFAFLSGAVRTPGVYEVSDGMTVQDLIEQAGGLEDDADVSMINLSDPVSDEMMIRIPSRKPSSGDDGSKMVNLNSASQTELMTLSGIGEAKAQSIISYRNLNGGFRSVEELLNIPGIGNEIFNRIKDFITI